MSVIKLIETTKRDNRGSSKLTMCLPLTTTNYLRSVKNILENNKNNKRISEKILEFSLFSYFYAGKDYSSFSRMFAVPTVEELKKHVNRWRNTPGLLDVYFQSLAIKTQGLDDKSKLCVLSVAEFEITPSFFYNITTDEILGMHRFRSKSIFVKADTVLVFMVQSLTSNWKQPLGYSFIQTSKTTALELMEILQIIIDKLTKLNLIVTSLIVPPSLKYQSVSRLYHVHEKNNYFISSSNRIQYFYDTGSILQSLWNIFMKQIVLFDGKDASLCNLFINQTNPVSINFLNELTNTVNKPSSEIFTDHFGELFYSYVKENAKNIPNGLNIYNLFKILKRIHEIFSVDTSCIQYGEDAVTFLQKTFTVLYYLRIKSRAGKDITNEYFIINCLLTNIKGIVIYWETLKSKNVLSLSTHKLTINELQKFNNSIKCGPEKNIPPTPRTFNLYFKKWFNKNYFENLIPKIQDSNLKFLKNDGELFLKSQKQRQKLIINTTDYKTFDLYKSDAMELLSSYLYKKCLENHKDCKNSICKNVLLEQERFGYFIDDPIFGVMVLPPKGFEFLVIELESFYANSLHLFAINLNVGVTIHNALMKKIKITFCPTFPLSYLIKLFIRIRIYYSLKSFNSIKT